MGVVIYREEFFKLEKEIFAKFEIECKGRIPADSQRKYGYGPYNDGDNNSLRSFISKSPQVAEYLDSQSKDHRKEHTGFKKINGKDLYDRARKFRNFPTLREMILDDIYEFVYFLYLGCDSIYDFRERYFPDHDKTETVEFRQYYYSYRNHRVKEAELSLTFSAAGIKAVQSGFLDQRPDVILEGIGRRTRYCLRLSMESREDDLMDLYLHVQYKNPKLAPMLLGIFVAQSAHHFPVSVETILVRKDLALSDEDMLQIERYLHLKRHHYRTNDPGYQSFQELRVKKPTVSTIDFLAGKTYRVWSYSKELDIIQVKFRIESNYKAELHSTDKLYDRNEQVQTCLLSINDAINQRLVVTMHPREGSGIIGTSILEIPNRQKAYLFTGVTCSVGLRNEHPSISFIALTVDDSDFKPDIIPQSEIKKYIAGNERLQDLHRELEKMRFATKN